MAYFPSWCDCRLQNDQPKVLEGLTTAWVDTHRVTTGIIEWMTSTPTTVVHNERDFLWVSEAVSANLLVHLYRYTHVIDK